MFFNIPKNKLDLSHHKIYVFSSVVLFAALFLGILCYELFGEYIIRSVYNGQSFPLLNNIIKYQSTKSVEHYLNLANSLFYKSIFVFSILSFSILLLLHLVYAKNSPKLLYFIVWGLFLIGGIYALNDGFRIYSSHGFLHAGIVYEILNGNVPPEDPLIGGEPILYPWGLEYVAAILVRALNISPSWAYAVINMVSYAGIACFVAALSKLLIHNKKANVFSVLIAVFCSTCLTHRDLFLMNNHFGIGLESRAAPLFLKLLNINGVPAGMFLYLGFIFVLLLIFSDYKYWKRLLFLLPVFTAGLAFIYIQMFIGFVASYGVFFIVKLVTSISTRNKKNIKKLVAATAATVAGGLVVLPYALSLTKVVDSKMSILNPVFALEDIFNLVVLALPVLVIILLGFNHIRSLKRDHVVGMASLLIGLIISYIGIRMTGHNEYKALIQALVIIGIFAGIVLGAVCTKRPVMVIILMVILFRPSYWLTSYQLSRKYESPAPKEVGMKVMLEGEENEMYEWVINNTSVNTLFIDDELKIPPYGQRKLFIGMDRYAADGQLVSVAGYHFSMSSMLSDISGYDPDLLDYRWQISAKILDPSSMIDRVELNRFFFDNRDILVVSRSQELHEKLEGVGFEKVFATSQDNYAVFKYLLQD